MKYISLDFYGEKYKLNTVTNKYVNNGNTYIGLITKDGEPFADVTVNIEKLNNPNICAVDTNNLTFITELLAKYKLIKENSPVGELHSGFCTYPLYLFDMDKVKEYERS